MNPILREAFKRHITLVNLSEKELFPAIEESAQIILDALKNGKKLLICGNGGSAADSQHFAAEIICKYKAERNPLPALALTTDSSATTAIANDFGFERVFQRQVKALGSEGDVLIAITTSGQSKNVLAAIEEAKTQGMKVVVLTGEQGEALRDKTGLVIAVPSTETARIQEVHELIYHFWCEFVEAYI